ncbi:MAG: lytic murein transglycosylase [Rhodospirillaceae bacterium]|nr:lytic murein transglycosylase [Rhodospirillaceae bacterium]
MPMKSAPLKSLHHAVINVAVTLILAACTTPERTAVTVTEPAPAPEMPAGPSVQDEAAFQVWLKDFRREAAAKGISARTLDLAFADIKLIPRVIELDRKQPEFTQTFWRYLDGAVSEARVRDGAARLKENGALLDGLEKKYGVPGRFLVAFWGLETNYGRNLGGYPVIHALATLAFEGRRATFFKTELFDALLILDRGHTTADKMVGSWAGAMGQTQFMPSTFLKHAVDETSDGRIDVWGQTPDALGSGAHYLQNLGWNPKQTWGREVRLPAKFDFTLASLDGGAKDTLKSLQEWSTLGLTRADGAPLPRQDVQAALIIPAGAKGPAFLVYDNFRAILKWNRSIFYAVAIGYLSDRITGGPALAGTRVNDPPMAREQVMALQSALQKLGELKAEPDGVFGSGTRQALQVYQRKCGFPADGYPSPDMVRILVSDSTPTTPCGRGRLGLP